MERTEGGFTCGFLMKVGWLLQPPALSGLTQVPWAAPSCHVLLREKMDVLTSVHVSSRWKLWQKSSNVILHSVTDVIEGL